MTAGMGVIFDMDGVLVDSTDAHFQAWSELGRELGAAYPREVFEPALRQGAASLIVVHNHPSGETDPSEDDLAITRRLSEAGEILGVPLLDHVIVGGRGYTSLKETQALP